MFEGLTKAASEFKKAKSVLLFSQKIDTVDKAVAMVTLAKACLNEGKDFQVICPKDLRIPIRSIFARENIEIVKELGSKDYIVSVDYGSAGIEKVICKRDEDTKKLNFVITPKDDIFNFDNVELISGSNNFDLVFSFNLMEIDEEIKTLFGNANVISISKKDSEIGKHKFLLTDENSYSEFIYEFLKAFSTKLSNELLDLLLQGILAKHQPFESDDDDGWSLVLKFIKKGADFKRAFRELNFSKDCLNLELQRKVMENLTLNNSSGIIWSKVSCSSGIEEENIDLGGRIIFNISKDFDLAFVIYHITTEKVKVVLESNNPKEFSAVELAKVFSGTGSKSRAIFSNKGIPAQDFEKRFFEQMEQVFGVTP